jgi:hypothetical protein
MKQETSDRLPDSGVRHEKFNAPHRYKMSPGRSMTSPSLCDPNIEEETVTLLKTTLAAIALVCALAFPAQARDVDRSQRRLDKRNAVRGSFQMMRSIASFEISVTPRARLC